MGHVTLDKLFTRQHEPFCHMTTLRMLSMRAFLGKAFSPSRQRVALQ